MNKKPGNYITLNGLNKLKEEYRFLKSEERPKVVRAVSYAAELGDRSENADYIYGKRRLREIDRRLRYLGQRIEDANVVDPSTLSGDKVLFGAQVTVENEDGICKTYKIVGADEIDASQGAISWKSPVATALLGKELGDEVIIRRPAGDLIVEIVKIVYS